MNKFTKKNSYNFKNAISNSNYDNEEDITLALEHKNYHNGSIYSLDWSVTGRLIATGSNDKTVKLMAIPFLNDDTDKEKESIEMTIEGHQGTVRTVCFDPSSDLIVMSGGIVDKCIKVWDVEKGSLITNLEGHSSDINTIKWSNDGLLCASAGQDRTIRFWDLRDYKPTCLFNSLKLSEINDLSIFTRSKTVTSTYIAAAHNDGKISIWDYYSKQVIKEIQNSEKEEIR